MEAPLLGSVEPNGNNTLSSLTELLLQGIPHPSSAVLSQLFFSFLFRFPWSVLLFVLLQDFIRFEKNVLSPRSPAAGSDRQPLGLALPCEPARSKGCLLLAVPSVLHGNHWCGVVCTVYPWGHLSNRVWGYNYHFFSKISVKEMIRLCRENVLFLPFDVNFSIGAQTAITW